MNLIRKLQTYSKHVPGWSTKRKLVVIESDDWGSTRMPNKEVRDLLAKKGILGNNNFLKYDTLATGEDLQLLFDVLSSVKDQHNNHGVFSPFVNVTNADFTRIMEADYREYFYEYFTDTLENYHGADVFERWKEGIEGAVFSPQYHGREHFNVPLLMAFLQKGHVNLTEAFKHGVIHIPIKEIVPKELKSLAPAYYFSNREELTSHKAALKEGVKIFEEIFSKPAGSFAAPNGIFHPELEKALADTSVQNLVVSRKRVEPKRNGELTTRGLLLKFGKKNKYNHVYYRRNVKFEPVQKKYSLEDTLFQVDTAFKFNKPAIISSHRINYVGSIDQKHRDKNLTEFRKLLKGIVAKYPDVEFISSSELGKIIRKDKFRA